MLHLCQKKRLQLYISTALSTAVLATACSQMPGSESDGSDILSTNIPHSPVGWQSIGNCWIYAFVGFVEALEGPVNNGEFNDYSDSYLTYLHIQEQLARPGLTEVSTGGSWRLAASLALRYGMVLQKDFNPSEAGKPFSDIQKSAVAKINESLKTGALRTDRSPEAIRAALDEAFGMKMAELEASGVIIPASKILVRGRDDDRVPLSDLLNPALTGYWRDVAWKGWNLGGWRRPAANSAIPFIPEQDFSVAQRDLFKAVKRAMNDGFPVPISWLVEFGAMKEGVFSSSFLEPDYVPDTGYHLTLLEDYVASGVDPETGLEFFSGEGIVDEKTRALATEHGDIRYFIMKNSWGGFDRFASDAKRTSWLRDGSMGYHRIDMDYLVAWMHVGDDDGKVTGSDTGLGDFALPARYFR